MSERELRVWRADLLSAAMVGTGRRPAPQPPTAFGSSRPDAPAPELLLDQAALDGALSRGGRRVGQGQIDDLPDPAPAEVDEVAPPRAAQLLELLLWQPPVPAMQRPLIAHWLRCAAQHRRIVSPSALPALFALVDAERPGEQHPLRGPLAAAWGERGAWLARVVGFEAPGGAAAMSATELIDGWATLSMTDLSLHLRALRESEPDRAREVIVERWDGLPARAKERVVQELEHGLSDSDEPFLETLLDDRAKGVRTNAQRLLRMLPNSAYSARMAARLTPLIAVERRLFAVRAISVRPPDHLDAHAERDGFVIPADGVEPDRMAWLHLIVSRSPLTTWVTAAGVDPDRIALLLRDDTSVIAALVDAVSNSRCESVDVRSAWAGALAEATGELAVLTAMPESERQRWLAPKLKALPAHDQYRARRLAGGSVQAPWNDAFANAVLDVVFRDRVQLSEIWALPASVHDRVRAYVDRDGLNEHDRRAFLHVLQYHALLPSIQEAFS
ncbi:DUF5691 domain-containing protein [Microbacterium sp. EST19A]|uniref:DUF5691 domain-containing protein n=1 Tax=Microbacterium sp. EST19A TaxID=2862681 RepID=UPI001CBB9188|nr:DUF5691 domain-containing protein [Microbacterium sp. EST19A]